MENHSNWDWENVKTVLSEGKAHAKELQQQLNPIIPTRTSSREACVILIEMLLTSYDNALTLINDDVFNNPSNSFEDGPKRREAETENSFADHKLSDNKSSNRKRKRSEQVRVRSEKGLEDLMNDGYNWRKYGQKVILNAAHPRAYYRCTHRHTQGCLATKQVQRADDDPSIFEVIYIGKHTCFQDTTKHSFETNKFEDSPKQMSMMNNIDEAPSFAFHSTTNGNEEDLKIESFSEENDYFSASHCLVNDFSIGQSFIQGSESDLAGIISSPTRVGDFVFGDIDTHFLDTYW